MRYYKGRIKNLRVEPKSLDWVAAATLWVLAIHVVVRWLLRLRVAVFVLVMCDARRR